MGENQLRKCLLALLILAVGQTTFAREQERLGIFVGASHFITQGEANTYDVSPNGVTGGLLVPVHLSEVPIFVKLKVVYHVADYTGWPNRSYDSYIQASNAFLAGVKAWRGHQYSVQVLLGPGIHNESVYSEWGAGVSSAELFADLSVIVSKHQGNRRIGALLSFERGWTSNDTHLVTDRRLQAAVIAVF